MLDAVPQLPVNDFWPRIAQEDPKPQKERENWCQRKERRSEGPAGQVAIVYAGMDK